MSLGYFRHFLTSQRKVIPDLQESFAGKTVIVTGSNTGLGYESAKHYLKLGASKVILAVRSIDKGNAAKEKLQASAAGTGTIEVWQLDMSSYASIEEFAAKAQSLDRIDVLLENAGMQIHSWTVNADGIESTMAVNVYGTIFLALLMLPLMRETAKKHNTHPIISIVTSGVHHLTTLKKELDSGDALAYLNDESKFDYTARYNVTKLLELYYVRELAKHVDLDKHGVIINATEPGLCHSDFDRNLSGITHSLMTLFRYLLARDTVDGAKTLVWPSTVGVDAHGKYCSDAEIDEKSVSRFVRSEEGAKSQKYFYDSINERLEKVKPGLVKDALTL